TERMPGIKLPGPRVFRLARRCTSSDGSAEDQSELLWMATVHLHVSDDPRSLLEEAASGFLRPLEADRADAFASPPHVLLLRQGGLRDDLIALAAERGVAGWFEPA